MSSAALGSSSKAAVKDLFRARTYLIEADPFIGALIGRGGGEKSLSVSSHRAVEPQATVRAVLFENRSFNDSGASLSR